MPHASLLARASRRLRAVLLVAVVGSAGIVVAAPAAHATGLLSCTQGSGATQFSPAISSATVGNVSTDGEVDFGDCSGSGVTAAQVTLSGVASLATCQTFPVDTVTFVGLSGTLTVTWTGGAGPATTTFTWTVTGAAAIAGVSVLQLVGTSTAGRFNSGTPAALAADLTIGPFTPSCQAGVTAADLAGSLHVVDVL
ncbi:hypothetical protein Lfu02_39710 [Longispora fulva]|uniref:Ig-like domain-containing protein n=1 Tax=Longispora fulva TaxID=619741 RepID=A0A8J7GGS3_9ACTN|nr:hypothetical protein [Longispora fulva]MBG6136432.1 hypothetical protein [Longispora fulva]GIG59599.1 hypothetical protein Lfu02_39710 [Longispora fulva]